MTGRMNESLELERPVWPEGQEIRQVDSSIAITDFDDMEEFHGGLVDYLVRREQERRAHKPKQTAAAGGTKIHHIDTWPVPGARLLDERAQEFYRRGVGHATSAVDLSWSNVYRAGDYILPHAHYRSTGSVLYMLSVGDRDEKDMLSGRFAFADPRMPLCCRESPDRMSTPHFPELKPGSMVLFPSTVVHMVTPYVGQKTPRITMTWNVNTEPLAERPASDATREIPPRPDGPALD